MSSPRHSFRTMKPGRGERRARGFTLLEMGLVLLIILLAAWLGLLLVARARQHQRAERFIADLQEFSAVFQDHHRQHGAWPPSTNGKITVPRGMEEILAKTNWARGSPFGGSYGWVEPGPARPDGRASRGDLVLTAFAPSFPLEFTRADLLEIDRRIDNGDLATGRFRTGFNGWPFFFVEAAKR